jgi:4-carboxymuconolactone decarboxylase
MTTPSTPTRLAPLPFAEWDETTRQVLLAHLRRPELYLSGAPDAPPMPVVMELFARHLPLSETFLRFTDVFVGPESTLDPRDRELAILRVAWRTGSGYEWHQHRRMGRDEGLTEAQLDAVSLGPGAAAWDDRARALVAAVDEMLDRGAVGDATWDRLAATYGPAQLLELLFVIGGYLCLATVLNSIGLRGELPTAGDPGEETSG